MIVICAYLHVVNNKTWIFSVMLPDTVCVLLQL